MHRSMKRTNKPRVVWLLFGLLMIYISSPTMVDTCNIGNPLDTYKIHEMAQHEGISSQDVLDNLKTCKNIEYMELMRKYGVYKDCMDGKNRWMQMEDGDGEEGKGKCSWCRNHLEEDDIKIKGKLSREAYNVAVCMQSGDRRTIRILRALALSLLSGCTYSEKECNVGAVYYTDKIQKKGICTMYPGGVSNDDKIWCTSQYRDHTMELPEYSTENNHLDICLRYINSDSGFMGKSSSCKFIVVIFAKKNLENGDNVRAAAVELKRKGASIHCFIVGEGSKYNTAYDEACDKLSQFESFNGIRTTIAEQLWDQVGGKVRQHHLRLG